MNLESSLSDLNHEIYVLYPIIADREKIIFRQNNRKMVFNFMIIIAILFANYASEVFAQRSSSSRLPSHSLSPNPKKNDDDKRQIKPVFKMPRQKIIGRASDNLYIRSENYLGCKVNRNRYDTENQINKRDECINKGTFFSEEKEIVLPAESKGFVDLPRMASKFVADKNNTGVAITFSALADNYAYFDNPLLIRVLVDGEIAEPNEITLLGGNDNPFTEQIDNVRSSVQSFTFMTNVDKGTHTVQVQYSTAAIDSGNSFLRNASLKINTELSGKSVKTYIYNNSTNWSDIPLPELEFEVPENGDLVINFSSVVKIEQGNSVLLKAIIDNGAVESYPEQIVLADKTYHTEARSVGFTANNLSPGTHSVRFEWRNVDAETITQLTAWSAVVKSTTQKDEDSFFDVVPQTDSLYTNDYEYVPVPGLESDVEIDEVSDVAVTLSGYFSGIHYGVATVSIDGVPQLDHEVSMHYGTRDCLEADKSGFFCVKETALENSGARSYTFGIKNLPPKNSPYKIGIALRKGGGTVVDPPGGGIYFHAIIDDSIMVVEKKRRVGPDLAVGPNMGRGSKKFETIIEPIYGTRQLLTIIIDPVYDSNPIDTLFYVDIDDTINGDASSVKDYYHVVSKGRLQIEKAGLMGPYFAEHAGEISNGVNYYKDKSNFGCDEGKEFKSGGDAIHAEAILQADNSFDFSQFDLNNDGKLVPSELGILIAIPAGTNAGSSIAFKPYCKGKLVVDGVEITEMVHFNAQVTNFGEDLDKKSNNMMTAAHEIGHHFLALDDMYTEGMFTTPGKLSTMDQIFDSTTHLDGFHKLHLGWARPSILDESREFTLLDVKKNEDVFILPRRYTDAREYIVLESRFNESTIDFDQYDYNILDSGLGVYHIAEPEESCKTNYEELDSPLDAAPDCKPLLKPICMSEEIWLGGHFSNFIRTGFRLISPDLSHKDTNGNTDYTESLFGVGGGATTVDLLDDGVMSCPANIGDPLPDGSSPYLFWVDGSPSGYRLFDIEIDAIANKTSFSLKID
ncbi:MAG: hypothetical protein GXO96_04825 [Nitrospirae bacterium]|nr:hypothetical protein [Candidatus Manganitrophaceae bacterium]